MYTREECKELLILTCLIYKKENKYLCKNGGAASNHYNKNEKLKESINYYTSYLPKESKQVEKWFHILYDLKEYIPPICCICGKPARFVNLLEGYREHCSALCSRKNKTVIQKSRQTCLKKYGCTNPSQSPEIREKTKKTLFKNYGVTETFKSDIIIKKGLQTKKERYENGRERPGVREDACLKKHNTKHPFQSQDIQKKFNDTMIKKYGFPWGSFPKELNCKTPRKYFDREKTILYQGKLEYKFIINFLNFYSKEYISNGPVIFYTHNNKIKRYYSDFVIIYPDKTKVIVEIKANHPFFYNSFFTGILFSKWDATLDYIKNNKEYSNYYFILNNEIVSKEDVINKYIIPYFHKNYRY